MQGTSLIHNQIGPMTRDEEILALALHADREHGASAPMWIAEQIGRLALDADEQGIQLWKSVARAWQELASATRQ